MRHRRRSIPWLWLSMLVLGVILFLPKDFFDQSGKLLVASGWLGNSPAAQASLGAPPA